MRILNDANATGRFCGDCENGRGCGVASILELRLIMSKLSEYLLNIAVLICLIGCSDYNVKNDGVYFEAWNEAQGKTEILIIEADKETFEKIADGYGKDKSQVFYRGRLVPGADPQTFVVIQGGYAIDRNRIYYYGDSVAESSSTDFKMLDPYFSRDHKDVYYTTEPLRVKNLREFKFLSNNNLNKRWSTDGSSYWFNSFMVPSVNYDAIILLDNDAGFSRDEENVYYLNRNLKYNLEGERILDTLDIATFEITGFIDCRDKFGCINIFHGRVECE